MESNTINLSRYRSAPISSDDVADLYKHGKGILRTYTGKLIDMEAPSLTSFCIEDIAHGASQVCRWAGQCPVFYSVAEHCIWMALRAKEMGANKADILIVLLHDATEAYMGDMANPLKELLDDYKRLETSFGNDLMIALKQRITPRARNWVKLLDQMALEFEWMSFFSGNPDFGIDPLSPPDAEQYFLRLYSELTTES